LTAPSFARSSSARLSVTLLSSGYEVQYVALRNILMIVQRRPTVLKNEVKVFFCKYNDPIYVKLAKLEIIFRLANEKNVEQVLAELAECVMRALTECTLDLNGSRTGMPPRSTSTL
jgi:vesicle coat complex subunit